MPKSTSKMYIPHGVTLSQNQRTKLAKALERREPLTIRLSHSELTGPDELMLTKTQIGRIQKSFTSGKGVDLKISKTQIGKVVKKGGSLFSSLAALVPALLPKAMQVASKVVPGLAMGALGSLGNFTMDKILGQGHTPHSGQVGGFLIPQDKVNLLIANKKYLTKKQKEDIVNALQSGGEIIIKPTAKQRGGFLGTLLATIGVPLLLNALSGKGLVYSPERARKILKENGLQACQGGHGLQNRQGGHGLQNRPYPYGYAPFPPPFIGQWGDGARRGSKKRTGKGILFGKNSPFNDIPLLGAIF